MRVEQNNKDGLIKEWGGGREGEAEGDREEEKKGTENSRGRRENSKLKKKKKRQGASDEESSSFKYEIWAGGSYFRTRNFDIGHICLGCTG